MGEGSLSQEDIDALLGGFGGGGGAAPSSGGGSGGGGLDDLDALVGMKREAACRGCLELS